MSPTIRMVAHCLFHQTPARERARCETCDQELRQASERWFCPGCLTEQAVAGCLICLGEA